MAIIYSGAFRLLLPERLFFLGFSVFFRRCPEKFLRDFAVKFSACFKDRLLQAVKILKEAIPYGKVKVLKGWKIADSGYRFFDGFSIGECNLCNVFNNWFLII